jgi:KipI family sensor histidine kinase inhibitor
LSPSPDILPFGDGAFLVELGDLADVLALHRGLTASSAPDAVVDIVPAARTILVTFEPRGGPEVRRWLARTRPRAEDDDGGRVVHIDVAYGGADLSVVATQLGVDEAEVVRRHAAARWRAAFTGFAPGFAYLVAPGSGLEVPRRTEPRTAVPAGSVGLAGEFSGIYPRSSPGGWQLIGTTAAPLWDATATEPALIRPGDVVVFREA